MKTPLSRRWRNWIATHRALSAALALAGAGAFAFALYWFQPWKLFVDERVEEAAPAPIPAPAAVTATTAPALPAPASRVLAAGAFRSLEHETSGMAKVLVLPNGSRVLRFEGLRTSNGPALVVILSPTPATEDSWTAYGKGDIVTLGPLKGNVGSQNYEIPAGADLTRYRSAVVWCRRFSVAFGAAPLNAPPAVAAAGS